MKSEKQSNIRDLFVSGQIQQVYKIFLKASYSEADFTWIVGSLCLLGKLDEAIALTKKRKLNAPECFFLLTAAIRKSDYSLTGRWFKELSKLGKDNDEAKFFYTQAIAFYAYYKCRYKNCLTIVKKSREYSLALKESFWKILALDLLGHTYMQMGNVHQGIMHLEEAHTLALLVGNTTFGQATKISILNYQSQFTDGPKAHIVLIEKKLRTLSKTDNYSEASLLLSLAHLHLLTGSQALADKALIKSQKIIFSAALPRHKALWFFERAYYYHLEGSYDLALSFLVEAEEVCNKETEKKIYIKILGLRRKIFSLLGKNTNALDKELLSLTKLIGDPLAVNKLARINLLASEVSEDPLQKIFDKPSAAIPDIIQTGYFGILREKLEDKKKSYLVTGLWKKGVLILTKEEAIVKSEGLSDMLLNTLMLLSGKKVVTKEELASAIWGYEYDPLRHDTSIYTLIHRLREVLGPLEKNLIGENHSYRFNHDFKHLDITSEENTGEVSGQLLHSTYKNPGKWNIRQHKALSLFKSGEAFKVSDYALQFNVSVITALRDLTELKNAKLINTYGKARATTYAL